jgi:hypothetical protein
MIIFAFLLIGFAFFAGCKKNDTVVNSTTEDPQATQDAATSISGSFAINNGGVLDQVADLLNTPTTTGILNKAINSDPNALSTATFSYDSTTGGQLILTERGQVLPGLPIIHVFICINF